MSNKKIKNNLKGVKISGDYTGGDKTEKKKSKGKNIIIAALIGGACAVIAALVQQ